MSMTLAVDGSGRQYTIFHLTDVAGTPGGTNLSKDRMEPNLSVGILLGGQQEKLVS